MLETEYYVESEQFDNDLKWEHMLYTQLCYGISKINY